MKARYRPDIDCLRAFAVLIVIGFHWQIPSLRGGFVGVDIFFVISGYLIAQIIFSEARAGQFSFINFYERRIRRILPALYVLVAIVLTTSLFLLLPPDYNRLSESALSVVTFSSNVLFWHEAGYFDLPSLDKPLLHTWSLSVEEQFYILFPAVILLVTRHAKGREAVWLSALAAASFLASVASVRFFPLAGFYLAPSRAWEFLTGALLACGTIPDPRSNAIRAAAKGAGILAAAIPAFAYDQHTPFPGIAAVAPCLGAALLIWAHSGGSPPYLETGAARPFVFLGKISYSLYLWHWPIFIFYRKILGTSADLTRFSSAQKAALLAVTLLIAGLSYWFIEQPVRTRQLAPTTRGAFAFAGLASALLLAFGAAGNLSHGFPQRIDPKIAALASYLDYPQQQVSRPNACATPPQADCMPAESGRRNIAVWGDSVAAHYVYGLQRAAAPYDVTIWQMTEGGCVPLPDYDWPDDPGCRAFNDGVRSLIRTRKPDAVLVSGLWGPAESRLGREEFDARMQQTLADMTSRGIRVILLGPSIEYQDRLPAVLANFAIEGLEHFDSRRYLDTATIRVDGQMREDFARLPGVRFLSVYQMACPQDACPALLDDAVPIVWDSHHLTAQGSLYVASRLFPSIARELNLTARR